MNTNVTNNQSQATKVFLEATVDVKRSFGIFKYTRPICRALRLTTGNVMKELKIPNATLKIDVSPSPAHRWHQRVSVEAEVYCTPAQQVQLESFLHIDLEHVDPRAYGAKVKTRKLSHDS